LFNQACGWFFNQPKTAISLIESLILNASEDEIVDIQQLIFHPLCVSYPGSIPDHMKALIESKVLAKNRCTSLLSLVKQALLNPIEIPLFESRRRSEANFLCDEKKESSNVEPKLLNICCYTKPENKKMKNTPLIIYQTIKPQQIKTTI
jgi:hypothetical protein